MEASQHFRQGDVLIASIAELPRDARPVSREEGRIILAHGEVTGHAHAIVEPDVELYEKDGDYFIRVSRTAVVRHEEHNPISLDRGDYRVIRQREYVPGAAPATATFDPAASGYRPMPMSSGWFRFVLD